MVSVDLIILGLSYAGIFIGIVIAVMKLWKHYMGDDIPDSPQELKEVFEQPELIEFTCAILAFIRRLILTFKPELMTEAVKVAQAVLANDYHENDEVLKFILAQNPNLLEMVRDVGTIFKESVSK